MLPTVVGICLHPRARTPQADTEETVYCKVSGESLHCIRWNKWIYATLRSTYISTVTVTVNSAVIVIIISTHCQPVLGALRNNSSQEQR